MPPDEPNEEERLEELPGDQGQTSFTPAGASRDDGAEPDDQRQAAVSQSDDTRPIEDTDVDSNELYQQGQPEVGSNLGNSVVDYDPENDKREES